MRHFRILARLAATALLLAAAPAIADTTVSGPVTFSTGLSVSAVGAVTLAVPSGSTLGGVKSATAGSHQFQTGIDTAGSPTFAQPALADLSDTTAQKQAALNIGAIQGGKLTGANFNSTADQAITIVSPTATYSVLRIVVNNSSCDMSAATVPVGGFYSAASKGGIQLIAASQSYSALSSTAINTLNNHVTLTGNLNSAYLNLGTIYFSLSTAHGSACTADIYVYILPMY